jgi:Pentapeptide repeats (8 copies)
VAVFSTYLATFPGEWIKTHLPEPSLLQALLFEGDVDTVSRRPQSVFSNRLVLTDQSFVVDPEKLDKITVSSSFRGRDLRLAVFYRADLRKADFTGAQLQGASLDGAQLQRASLDGAQLQGASLIDVQLQGANLTQAQLQGAEVVNMLVWRAFGTPNLDLANLQNIDSYQKPWKDNEAFGEWRDAIANSVAGPLRDEVIERLVALDPIGKKEPEDVLDQRYWDTHSSQPQGEEVRRKRAMFLADLACWEHSALYVARGLLRNLEQKGNPEFLDADGLRLFTDRLLKGKSDPATCPGVRGFIDTDWADLSKLSSETLTSR